MATERVQFTSINGKLIRATRYDGRESSIPGAEHWGWRMADRHDGGLNTDEQGQLEEWLRGREAAREGSDVVGH